MKHVWYCACREGRVLSAYSKELQKATFTPVMHIRLSTGLEFGHPPCVCNNELKYNEGQNTTKFIS